MSSSNDRYFGTSYGKSRRGSPADNQGVFFQTGQGGRTVLPPISSAFPISRFPVPAYPSQYTPRSSPARYEVNPQALYNHWPSATSPEPASSYPNYETHDRYSTQGYNYTSRTPPIPAQIDNRKLPPLATNAGTGWTTSYLPTSNYQGGGIRSPTASYPPVYSYPATTTQSGAYTYLPAPEHSHVQVPSMNPASHISSYNTTDSSRSDHHRSSTPYGSRSSSHVSPPTSTPPPVSPTSPDESTIKKKRKRADANQLKILNETYNRTAFPSTEERLELAKKLDMSARSVQIWFQNKRQSMRQTNRQSSTVSSSSQPFTLVGQDMLDDLEPAQMGYGGSMPMADAPYPSRHSPDASRSHSSQQVSSHRRIRHPEEAVEHRKWY
ncbi:Homeobox protein YOX1 [Hypsizygus marmoreus]|uniref:Homeobox protein YOX1 n=1 Tax=Hypsizygus marmoreus TaxID=39966 RepID=A0A369JSB4_HYPMA|nr:Homeobox protein YOX1 [Hypsizygus marmoreus]